jgi:hypothetical protein
MTDEELQVITASLATRDTISAEGERLREHMTALIERQARRIQALIDAIELLKYIDSTTR